MCICLFFPSFSDSLVDSWIHSLSHLPIHSCIHSVSHLLHCPYIHNHSHHSHHYSCTLGTRWSPGGHQVVTRWSPGGHQVVTRQFSPCLAARFWTRAWHSAYLQWPWQSTTWHVKIVANRGGACEKNSGHFSVSVFCGLQCISVVYSSWRVIEAERCDWKWTWALIIFLLWKCR